LACWGFSTALLPFFLFVVFALYERKNDKRMIETYHAAAGESCGVGYPLGDAKQRKCVTSNSVSELRSVFSGWMTDDAGRMLAALRPSSSVNLGTMLDSSIEQLS
jgi:hypothetical protein